MAQRVKTGCGGADKPAPVNKARRSLFFIIAAFIDEIKLSAVLKCARMCSAQLCIKCAMQVTWSRRGYMIFNVSAAFIIYLAASLSSSKTSLEQYSFS